MIVPVSKCAFPLLAILLLSLVHINLACKYSWNRPPPHLYRGALWIRRRYAERINFSNVSPQS